MGDIDWKGIGLGAKDVVVGIAGAVAGVYGGSGAATAVTNAGRGIDKIVDAAAPETHEAKTGGAMADKKTTQAEKFDRADFTPPKKQPAKRTPVKSVAQTANAPAPELLATVDYLRQRGWSMAKIRMILAGPDQNSIHAITGQGAAGVKVAKAQAAVVPEVMGVSLSQSKGRRLPASEGRRVSPDKSRPKATEATKPSKPPPEAEKKDASDSQESDADPDAAKDDKSEAEPEATEARESDPDAAESAADSEDTEGEESDSEGESDGDSDSESAADADDTGDAGAEDSSDAGGDGEASGADDSVSEA